MYKYVLFDFDGTLVDTNELITLCLQKTCVAFTGKPLSNNHLQSILGKHLEEQMKCICDTKYLEMVLYYKNLYKTNQDHMTKLFPGIKDMLNRLKQLNCKIAIVSAKGRGGIEHGLHCLKLTTLVDTIVSAYDVQNNKPHPEPALKALDALCGNRHEAIMVGDSPYDILCGQNAQIKTVLVNWTIFPMQEILKLNPDYVANSPEEIIGIVQKR